MVSIMHTDPVSRRLLLQASRTQWDVRAEAVDGPTLPRTYLRYSIVV